MKLYYVETNGYDMVIADHGDHRTYLTDSSQYCVRDNRDRAEAFLNEIEDDSSWDILEETVEELTAGRRTDEDLRRRGKGAVILEVGLTLSMIARGYAKNSQIASASN